MADKWQEVINLCELSSLIMVKKGNEPTDLSL